MSTSEEQLDYLKIRELNDALPQYQSFHSGEGDTFDSENIIELIKSYETLNKSKRGVPVLVDFQNLKPLYVGAEAEKHFGFDGDGLIKLGSKSIFKLLSLDHVGFPLKGLSWAMAMNRKSTKKIRERGSYLCGMKLRNQHKEIVRAMFDIKVLSSFKNGNPHYVLMIATNVTHLIKGDFYWGYFIEGSNGINKAFFNSKFLSKSLDNIFSKREFEILELLNKGKSSLGISEELFISKGTVEKHRKNMIARIGARDTTALLQLSKMMDLIV